MYNSVEALKECIRRAGGQTHLARVLTEIMGYKVRQSTISNWLNRNQKMSSQYVIPLCKYFDWEIEPNDLRPDVFPKGVKIEE